MRSEKEMLDLIIRTAREDERIIAAYLEGSRVDPNAQKDIFRDYDVEYIVRDTAPFIADKSWIDRFGERLFMQYPDDCPFEKSDTKKLLRLAHSVFGRQQARPPCLHAGARAEKY